MNKVKFFLLGSLLSLWLLNINSLSAQTPADEYMAISESLSYYLDGGTYNDFSRLSKAFHKDATMKHVGEEYKAVNALAFFGKHAKPGPPQNRTTKIISINFEGKAANAVLLIETPTVQITDFMNLLKIDGKWKIVSKIFYGELIDTTSPPPTILSPEEKEVLSTLHRWKMAYINQNTAEVDKVLAEDWTYSGGADGQLGLKKATVEGTKNATTEFLEVNFKNLITRKVGEVIMVSGQEELKMKEDGKVNTAHLMFTDGYQKIDGQWQAIFTHSSEIKQ